MASIENSLKYEAEVEPGKVRLVTSGEGGSRSVATRRDADATERVPPVRKHPSRNSILTTRDNRAIILFVTVVTDKRQCVLDDDRVQSVILDVWQRTKGWIVGRYVIMPDHIHFFCAPADYPPSDFHAWMACWKRMVSNRFPCPHSLPLWQRDCWDVQLRCGESYADKWDYVRANPVRKGLADSPDSWPYQGELNVLMWHDR